MSSSSTSSATSKLLVDQQRRLLETLNQIVRGTEQFRKAEANHRLITIPTGDGMALVFYNTPEAPVECALEISRAVKEHPELINDNPYDEGWMLVVKISNPSELDNLMSADKYQAYLQGR